MTYLSQNQTKLELSSGHVVHGARVTAFISGLIVVFLALNLFLFDVTPSHLFAVAQDTLGLLFLLLVLFLILVSTMAVTKMRDQHIKKETKSVWLHLGVHAANGIATVALTFTLFGISVGVGELTAGNLNIDNVNKVIASLTEQFSMAFMTSVVGLPLSALMRVVVGVTGKSQGL